MIENEIVVVRGFDMFFNGASEVMLQHIADKIGESSTHDHDACSATYMFTKNRYCEFGLLERLHLFIGQQGLRLAEEFGCTYEASELYLTVSPSVTDWMTDNGFDITQPLLI